MSTKDKTITKRTNKFIEHICEHDGAFTNLKIKKNIRIKAEQDENKAFEELQQANQKMQELWQELTKEK